VLQTNFFNKPDYFPLPIVVRQFNTLLIGQREAPTYKMKVTSNHGGSSTTNIYGRFQMCNCLRCWHRH
jgi:hypothetical protein